MRKSFPLPITIIPSNVDHLNGQSSTSEHAQSPRSHDLPKIFSFLQFGPRIPCGWPRNDGVQRMNTAVLSRVFSLYVGSFVFRVADNNLLVDVLHRPELEKKPSTEGTRTHRFFFTYTYLQSQTNPDSY
jgi:hypothetical protein